jgi:hypothetical protein
VHANKGGPGAIAQYQSVNIVVRTMEIALYQMFAHVKWVGKDMTAQYLSAHRIVTMVVYVWLQTLVDVFNGKISGGTAGFMEGFHYIKHRQEILN